MAHDHSHKHPPTESAVPPAPPAKRLPGVKHIIAVASGKGGVGKSTVSVNLACALSQLGHRVGLLDADIYGPSQHIMVGLKEAVPMMDPQKKILPLDAHGLKVLSFGFFVKPEEAVVWRGPLAARMLQQFIEDVKWNELDFLVVDMPPGTGDIQLSLTQLLAVSGAVIVTTPQDVALADAIKGVNMFQKVNVPILGMIENMSYFECPHCQHQTSIFDQGGGQRQATDLKVPFLGKIPLEVDTRSAGDTGTPIVVAAPQSAQTKRFLQIASQLLEEVKAASKTQLKIGTEETSFDV